MKLSPKKIMVLDSVHPVLMEELEKLGFTCHNFSECSSEEISTNVSDFQGIILRSRFVIDSKFLEKCTALKFILRSGSGMENIDTTFAKGKGVVCINSPEGNADAVGEHVIGMLLNLFNKICVANNQIKKGDWLRESNRGIELKGKTIAIIGYGVMGRTVAKKLTGFECKTLVYDTDTNLILNDKTVKQCTMDQIFASADIVSIHVNFKPENEYLVNSRFIDSFQKPFYLINSARGKCVDTKALIGALKEQKVLGACLDVNEFENHNFQQKQKLHPTLKKLSKHDNVILTPHVAGWTTESYYKLSLVLLEKLKNIFDIS